MKKIVVDSSVIVKWVSSKDEKNLTEADQILKDCEEEKVVLYSSEVAKYEVGNALVRGKELPLPQAFAALGTIYSLPIVFVSENQLLAQSTYETAHKKTMTYYDAAFVSLAKSLDATLVTDNIKHQKGVAGVTVIPLADYR